MQKKFEIRLISPQNWEVMNYFFFLFFFLYCLLHFVYYPSIYLKTFLNSTFLSLPSPLSLSLLSPLSLLSLSSLSLSSPQILDRFPMEEFEHISDMKLLQLRTKDKDSEEERERERRMRRGEKETYKSILAVGTSFFEGEDVSCKGRIIMFEFIKVCFLV